MVQDSMLIQLLEQQIDVENQYVKRLNGLRDKVGIAAARLLLLEMRLDTEKRIAILGEMKDILKGVPQGTSLWNHTLDEYVDQTLVKKEFEEEVKRETANLERLKKEMAHTTDEGLKLLRQNIEQDEKKHDEITKTIVKNLYRIQ
jgi:hypothetical protein